MTTFKMSHDTSKRLKWIVTLTLLFSSRVSRNLVKPRRATCLRLPLMSARTDRETSDKERDKDGDKHKQKWHGGSKRVWNKSKQEMEAETARERERGREKRQGKSIESLGDGEAAGARTGWERQMEDRETEALPMALQRDKVALCVKTSTEELSLVIPGLLNLIAATDSTAHPPDPPLSFLSPPSPPSKRANTTTNPILSQSLVYSQRISANSPMKGFLN